MTIDHYLEIKRKQLVEFEAWYADQQKIWGERHYPIENALYRWEEVLEESEVI